MESLFSELELREAARAIESALHKSEKAMLKLKENSAQFRLTADGIAAYQVALTLIAYELSSSGPVPEFADDDLQRAAKALSSLSSRVEKVLPKFAEGTPQYTLAIRRMRAFEIAIRLIENR